ncbi:site-specific DNA-methyltransferase, partial [Thalassolituus sp.]|uniref:site-specific DNA-methyltransferase n=1 Tax=Thalassolituus sp. TaxID=2030822 RepID=UPI003510EBCA
MTDLIARASAKDAALGEELEKEFKALSSRRAFGLNFERHKPESVELPGRPVRKGDKVRILPPRGSTKKGDQTLWKVLKISKSENVRVAELEQIDVENPQVSEVAVDDLVVVAEFRDYIYPGLVSTGKVERGGDKPYHTVINGENFHVLEALTYTHRSMIDLIYIDPPYNSGARDWKYNNDYVEEEDLYRHSKWLAFIERRLKLATLLLKPSSVLIVAIDEKEYLRLGLLLEQTFPEARIQMVSALINPAAVARVGGFGRSDEYLFFVFLGDMAPSRVRLDREWVSGKGRTHTGKIRWDLLRRSGTNAERSHSPGCFYPIYVDPNKVRVVEIGEPLPQGVSKAPEKQGLVAVLPIRKDGSEGNWQWSPETFRERFAQGRVKIGGSKKRGFTVYILKPGEYSKIERGEFKLAGRAEDGSLIVEDNDPSVVTAIPGSQWRISRHDSTQYGSRLISSFVPGRKFPFPKSIYAVEDAIRFFVADNPSAIVLDFFAGSGTTAHAVMRLNRQDSGKRQTISITNNEVAAE